jgi:hypothetical protein
MTGSVHDPQLPQAVPPPAGVPRRPQGRQRSLRPRPATVGARLHPPPRAQAPEEIQDRRVEPARRRRPQSFTLFRVLDSVRAGKPRSAGSEEDLSTASPGALAPGQGAGKSPPRQVAGGRNLSKGGRLARRGSWLASVPPRQGEESPCSDVFWPVCSSSEPSWPACGWPGRISPPEASCSRTCRPASACPGACSCSATPPSCDCWARSRPSGCWNARSLARLPDLPAQLRHPADVLVQQEGGPVRAQPPEAAPAVSGRWIGRSANPARKTRAPPVPDEGQAGPLCSLFRPFRSSTAQPGEGLAGGAGRTGAAPGGAAGRSGR